MSDASLSFVQTALVLVPGSLVLLSCNDDSGGSAASSVEPQQSYDLVDYPLWLAPKYIGNVDATCRVDQKRRDAMMELGWTLVDCAQRGATFVRTALLAGKLSGFEVSQPEKITIGAEFDGGYWQRKFKVFSAYPSDKQSKNYILKLMNAENLGNVETFGTIYFNKFGNAAKHYADITIRFDRYQCNVLHQINTFSVPQTVCIWSQKNGWFVKYYGHRLDFPKIIEMIKPVKDVGWDIWQ